MKYFEKELVDLLDKHSVENECDIPDFLLAEMIVKVIRSIGPQIKRTLDWHGCDSICHPAQPDKPIVGEYHEIF